MTDIALLMTGVLKTGQLSLLSVANKLFVQQDNSVEESNQGQLSPIVATAQITPPEFVQLDETTNASPSAQTIENKNRLNQTQKASILKSLIASDDTPVVSSRRRRRFSGRSRQGSYQTVTAISYEYTNQPLPTLSFGTSGIIVKALQKLLSHNGYVVRVDGNFGALTEAAVKSFQNQRNLGTDGVVGQKTWMELTK